MDESRVVTSSTGFCFFLLSNDTQEKWTRRSMSCVSVIAVIESLSKANPDFDFIYFLFTFKMNINRKK